MMRADLNIRLPLPVSSTVIDDLKYGDRYIKIPKPPKLYLELMAAHT